MKPRLIALIAFACLIPNVAARSHAAAPASAAAPATMAHISIAETGTKGPPVILIPGLSTPRDVYAGIAPALAKTHRVYLVQVNGFAGEDPGANLRPGVLDGMVADLHAFIATRKLAGAAVVGHSMGGLAALMWAKAHPADVGRLMVVDALPYSGDLFMPDAKVAAIEPQAAAMRDQVKASYGQPADKAGADATAAGLALKPGSRASVSAWSQKADPRVVAEALYEDLTTDLRPDLAAIKPPITLVYPWGGQMPKARADAFYRAEYARAPNVRYVDIADSAHFAMLDQPEAFAAAVQMFLAGD